MSEASFQDAVVLALQTRYKAALYLERRNVGAVVTRDRAGNQTGMFHASKSVGAADYFGILGGLHFEVEFKAAKGKQREGQVRFQQRMEGLAVPYFLLAPGKGEALGLAVDRAVALFAEWAQTTGAA